LTTLYFSDKKVIKSEEKHSSTICVIARGLLTSYFKENRGLRIVSLGTAVGSDTDTKDIAL